MQGCYRGAVGGIAWFIKYDTVRSCYRGVTGSVAGGFRGGVGGVLLGVLQRV